MILMLVDRVLSLLDTPGIFAVIIGAVDGMGAFDRTDFTKTVQKIITKELEHGLFQSNIYP